MLKQIRRWHSTRHMWLPSTWTGLLVIGATFSAVSGGFTVWQLYCSGFAVSYWVASLVQAHLAKAASIAATTDVLMAAEKQLRYQGVVDVDWLAWEAQRVSDHAKDPDWYPPLRSSELIEQRHGPFFESK